VAVVPVIQGSCGKTSFYDALGVADEHRGWPLGVFVVDGDGVPLTDAFEISWRRLKAGEERAEWSVGGEGCAITLVIRGSHEFTVAPNGVDGETTTRVLDAGEAIFWENMVPHKWRAVTDNEVITIRRLKN
jgi:hypothetical protein